MYKQFFGKETWWWLIACAGVYALAPLAWWQPAVALILLGVGFFGSTYLTSRNLVLGLSLVFVELAIGGHGLLIHEDIGIGVLTLRHVVFFGFFTGYAWRLLTKKSVLKQFNAQSALVAFVIWLVVSFAVGGIQNGWNASFDEFNSYFYLALLIPIFGHVWTGTEKRRVLTAAFGGILFLSVITLLFAFSYNHLPGKAMNVPYTVYRDARVTEVSLQVVQSPPAGAVQSFMEPLLGMYPYWYRIFNTSHIFLLIALLTYGAYACMHGVDRSVRKHWVLMVGLVGAALCVSMSRSMILALMITALVGIGVLLRSKALVEARKALPVIGGGAIAAFMSIAVFAAAAALPIPERPDLREATFYATSAGTTRQAAVASRWTLLPELMAEITKSPIVGHGFGRQITYQSSDPRIISTSGGTYTTYRFEWGYQDLLLKMGAVGVLLYMYLLWRLLGHVAINIRNRSWLEVGMLMAVFAVCVANVFTPYLNHPLGMGVILLAVIVSMERGDTRAFVPNKEGNIIMTFPSVTPVSVALEDRG